MAEQRVIVEGGYNATTGAVNPLSVGISGQPLSTWQTSNPLITGAYLFSIENQPGVVASNNFMTIFNPVGSGKVYVVGALFISCVASAATGAVRSMRAYRINALPTGGTTQAASTVCKLDTAYPDTAADIRINNPTVTALQAATNTPPPVTTGAGGGQFVHQLELPPGAPPFKLRAGEGLVLNVAAGDTDQVWNLSVAWSEI